jgi:aryl-alcohol dehydrogenase
MLAGRLPLDRLVRTYAFDQINDAAHDMHAGTTIKPVLLMR